MCPAGGGRLFRACTACGACTAPRACRDKSDIRVASDPRRARRAVDSQLSPSILGADSDVPRRIRPRTRDSHSRPRTPSSPGPARPRRPRPQSTRTVTARRRTGRQGRGRGRVVAGGCSATATCTRRGSWRGCAVASLGATRRWGPSGGTGPTAPCSSPASRRPGEARPVALNESVRPVALNESASGGVE